MMRQAQGSTSQTFSFGKSKARVFDSDNPEVSFSDVQGVLGFVTFLIKRSVMPLVLSLLMKLTPLVGIGVMAWEEDTMRENKH